MSHARRLFSDGEAYERSMGRWSRIAGEIFLDWLDAPKRLSWLDVGCGNGAFTEVLIARCAPAAVTGIDPSQGQLDFARTRPGARLAQFERGDAQTLPFADGSFDAAAMALAINFVSDPQKAANEMARVVKRGGLAATYMWDTINGGSPLSRVHAAIKSLGMPIAAAHSGTASLRENLLGFWQRAGLQAIEMRQIRIAVVYSDVDDFWDSVSARGSTTGEAIADMPPAARAQLKARLREQLPIAADGSISYEAFANAVKGRVPQ
jgi:SAM-dependent methyltransferase